MSLQSIYQQGYDDYSLGIYNVDSVEVGLKDEYNNGYNDAEDDYIEYLASTLPLREDEINSSN